MPPNISDRLTVVEHRLERLESGMEEIREALIVEIQLRGPTIHWFNLWHDSTKSLTWENLTEAMMARFGGGCLDNNNNF